MNFKRENHSDKAQEASVDYSRQWLLAMPNMSDDDFRHALIYLCLHDKEGAMGFMLNRPADFDLHAVFEQLALPVSAPEQLQTQVLIGGPVFPEQGYVLHDGDERWSGSKRLSPSLVLSPGKDLLEAIAADQSDVPENYQVIFGYCGWSEQQLEDEILDNCWHIGDLRGAEPKTRDPEHDLIFTQPYETRWQQMGYELGIDFARLSWQIGSA